MGVLYDFAEKDVKEVKEVEEVKESPGSGESIAISRHVPRLSRGRYKGFFAVG
jgi:hypothetical protein